MKKTPAKRGRPPGSKNKVQRPARDYGIVVSGRISLDAAQALTLLAGSKGVAIGTLVSLAVKQLIKNEQK